MNKSISIFALSDIHHGHDKTISKQIITNTNILFKQNMKLILKANIIVILGDLFDKLLSTTSESFIGVVAWMSWLAHFCKNNNIKLRLLEGTFSHDRKQGKAIEAALSDIENLDFKYIDKIFIERIDEYDTDILYVPDDTHDNSEDIFTAVTEILENNNLTTVDIAFMHGQFNHHLPNVQSPMSHDEDSYLNIVKTVILIGHIHTHSVYERIITPGSLDRLSHNQEESKGGIFVTVSPNTPLSYLFVENKTAKVYKTIYITHTDVGIALKKIMLILNSLPIDSHIRINIDKDNPIALNSKDLTKRFPNFFFTIKREKKEIEQHVVINNKPVETFNITKDNIEELLLNEFMKHKPTTQQINIAKTELSKIL